MDDFGPMGSNKLVGSKYRAHFPTMTLHPAAQFDPVFRNLVKTEVAKLSTENELPTENDLVADARCDSCAALY